MNTLTATSARTHSDLESAEWATLFLDELMASVGVDGLVAALRHAPLLASVEAHAAAVRESLAAKGLGVHATSLAGYASLLLAVARGLGHTLPADPAAVDWAGAEWYLLRLVAVCSLAEEAGCL